MSHKLENVPNAIKHTGDAITGGSVVLSWIATLTPFMNFAIVLLAIFWGFYRIQDMRLSIEIKKEQLKDAKDNE